jgi:hypothetical protein
MATIPFYINPEMILNKLNAAGIALDTIANVYITAMISIRILDVARNLRKSTESQATETRTYTNVVAILIESAAPCAILGIMTCVIQFMINDGSTSPFIYIFGAVDLLWSASIVSI